MSSRFTQLAVDVAGAPAAQPGRRALWFLVCIFTVAYALVSLFRHWHFGSSYDLAIFDQAVWHMSRLEAPASTVSGHASIFGDHFSPILVTLVPLYWLWSGPETLLVAQAALLAVSIVAVHLFLRTRLDAPTAWLLSMAYGCFWGLQRTALFDFHELAFAPLLLGWAVLDVSRRRWSRVWLLAGLVCLIKEDMMAAVVGLGLFMIYLGHRRQGLLLAAAAFATFVVVTGLLIPWLNNGGAWGYGAQYRDILVHPWLAPVALVTPVSKLKTVAFWLLPFVGLPLFSPFGALSVPIVIERLLSPNPNHWGYGGHYSAPLAPLFAMAAGDALARFARRDTVAVTRQRLTLGCACLCVLASALVPGHQPLLRLFQPGHYRSAPAFADVAEALRLIPGDASVVAQAALAPHLAHRDRLYILEDGVPHIDVDFLVTSGALPPWPIGDTDTVARIVGQYVDAGFEEVFRSPTCLLLKRR